MSKENIEITVLPGEADTNLTIREGKALELKEPRMVVIMGDINTVAAFIKKRGVEPYTVEDGKDKKSEFIEGFGTQLQTIYGNRSIVEVDKEAMTIELFLDPENFYGGKVTGKLSLTEDVKQFGINTTKVFTREEVVKVLRFNKRFFPNKDLYDKLLQAFQSFDGKANVSVKSASDNRANRDEALQLVTKSNLPTIFIVEVPVFKGVDAFKFKVEICYDYSDGGFIFWFESPELKEMVEKKKDEIFDKQIEACKGLVVINK